MGRIAPAALALLALAPLAAAQRGGAWFTPSAADWKKPPLPQWQRSLEDALAVARATNRPILICVNMDGEAASENYAGVRYRDPEFAALVAKYVPLIVSPDRHTARDYDAEGKRIPCPRFGGVVCSEHIQIEPVLFAKYFGGQRVAPRHLGVTVDGKTLFDCYLNTEIAPVLKALGANGGTPPKIAYDPGPAELLVSSRDAKDRFYVEAVYAKSDAKGRRTLLEAAAKTKGAEPFELIRLGLRDADAGARDAARKALAATATANALPLLLETLRQTKNADERKVLTDALFALSKSDLRARVAAAVHRALAEKPTAIDAVAWRNALAAAKTAPEAEADVDALERRIQELGDRAKKNPNDGRASLELARETIRFAEIRMAARKDPSFLLEDAKRALDEAAARGEKGAAWSATRARVLHLLGQDEAAGGEALGAIGGLLALPSERALPNERGTAAERESAEVLWLAARGLRQRIVKARADTHEVDSAWITNAHAIYGVLALHPRSQPAWLAEHYDLLVSLDVPEVAFEVLERALARFPDDAPLHERLRASILADRGLDALEEDYAKRIQAAPKSAPLQWFAGYAGLVTAEFHKRAGESNKSKEAYGRAIEHFDKSIALEANYTDTADHYAAMGLAGRARVEMEEGDLDAAVADLAKALDRKPSIIETEDGLGRTPMITIQAIRWLLDDKKRADLREKLESALEAVDPDLASRPAK